MQVSEMRTLRALYAQKHLFSSIKFNPRRPSLISCKYSLNPQTFRIQRNIHSTTYCPNSASFPKTNGKISTFYDPVTGDIVTQAITSDKEDYDPKLSNSYYQDALQDDNRSYGSVVKAQQKTESGSSDKEEYNPKLSNSYPKDGLKDVNRSYGSVVKPQNESSDGQEKSIPATGYNDSRRAYGSFRKSNQNQLGRSMFVNKNKKGKVKTQWVCSDCGNHDGQWWGMCPFCKSAGTMKQFSVTDSGGGNVSGIEASENIVKSWLGPQLADDGPVRLIDVNKGMNQADWRIPLFGLFGNEVAAVLGGGLVPGSLVLVGGDPGVGKSTLVLQMAAMIAEGHGISQEDPIGVVEGEELTPEKQESLLNGTEHNIGKPAPVIYVSGEESVDQIKNRADRMDIGAEELYLYASTDIEDILDKAQRLFPRALVIDSIQTVYLKGVTGSAGSISQVKECTSALLRFAKTTNVPVVLIGHLTKSGEIAGPRILEHIVDAVLYMEGESNSTHRLLRSVKNRFGSTDELGVFDMSQKGLQAVVNPSEMFLGEQYSDSEVLAGRAVAVIMDGSRTFLIEIQALCVAGSSPYTQVNGVPTSKANMIIAVLTKQTGLKLQANAIFLNVVSGVTLKETAGDLAVAAAICSSFLEFPIPNGVAFIGEIGLDGLLRMVPRMEKRVMTVARLGYTKCVVPKPALKFLSGLDLGGLEIFGCGNMKEVINTVFKTYA